MIQQLCIYTSNEALSTESSQNIKLVSFFFFFKWDDNLMATKITPEALCLV